MAMKALFIANLELKETEGIFKKVCAQSDAVGNCVGECKLITRSGKNTAVKEYKSNKLILTDIDFYSYIEKSLYSGDIRVLYVRHMVPSLKLISFLKVAKRQGIKIYYEIPTYPYFGEQLKASRKKYRAIVKISLDIIFWPFIYQLIDKLVVIRSSSKAKLFKKMIEITNGVRTDNIKAKDYSKTPDNNVFRMVTVGTIYPYHGYDRIINGLKACGEKIENTKIEFHVVGNSQTIDDLHIMSDIIGLNNVFFHGIKTTDELNEMYDSFDVGLGCLALHRRNADIDTTLKVIEYYCRGVPIVTSGIGPSDALDSFTVQVEDGDTPIDISGIYKKYKNINPDDLSKLSKIGKNVFEWDKIVKSLIKEKV